MLMRVQFDHIWANADNYARLIKAKLATECANSSIIATTTTTSTTCSFRYAMIGWVCQSANNRKFSQARYIKVSALTIWAG